MAEGVQGRARWLGTLVAAAVALGLFLLLAALGHGSAEERGASGAGVATAVWLVIRAGSIGGAYILSGMGWGRVVIGAMRVVGAGAGAAGGDEAVRFRHWLQAGLGVGVLLWMSHLLGVLGLLSGSAGMWVGWGVLVVGLVLLVDQVFRGGLRPEGWRGVPAAAVVCAPGLALLLIAACNPPLGLWRGASREGGGYDVLSYHLQLPKEWAAGEGGPLGAGRLWPLEHNVYSFLPGYMEAAYLHIAAMTGAGRRPSGGSPGGGEFVGGEGTGVIAAQMVHAGMGILTAVLVGACVVRIAAGGTAARRRASHGEVKAGGDGKDKESEIGDLKFQTAGEPRRQWTVDPARRGQWTWGAVVGAACVLSTPWVTVVGSLAYNELAVTALLATGLLACLETGLTPMQRAIAAGLCAGLATSAKPTAALMAAPVLGIFLLAGVPARQWARVVIVGSVAGLAAVAPWVVRNWVACGNPVFPFATSIFGSAHWTEEQVARYGAAHAFNAAEGGGRLARLFSSRYGVFHHQWAILFPLAAAALVAAMASRRTRSAAMLLGAAMLTQLIGWMFFTHLQVRFLLPLMAPGAIAIGLAASLIPQRSDVVAAARRPIALLARLAAIAAPLSLAVWSALNFFGQNADMRREGSILPGAPNALLVTGIAGFTGQAFFADLGAAPEAERERFLREEVPPAPYLNWILKPGEAVYLLGGATPLYLLPAGGNGAVVYHTTWDRSPLGDAVRRFPGDEAAWTRAIVESSAERGGARIAYVLVEFDELERLSQRDAWYDPVVTPELVRQWLSKEGEAVRSWPGRAGGTVLFRMKSPPAPGGER